MALKGSGQSRSQQSERHGDFWHVEPDEHRGERDAASLQIWGVLALVCLTIWLVVGFAAWFYLIR